MTTTKLSISSELALPLDVVTSTLVVYGGKGMGKTNLASVLVEELTKARLRWCLLDPMGVSWGLRHSLDGKGPGVSCVILGGAHGDIPIEPTGGAVVADLVVDEHADTIIDFSRRANGTMWSKAERIRFVTDYTTRLFQRQGELVDGHRREPIMQLLDEAARFIPQTIPASSPMLAECVGAWEQVCEEGRNIGLGVALITQRSARMNKSVSELADVMFAFRIVGPNSLAAVMDWLGEHVEKERIKTLASQVRQLDVGQALVVSPGWLRVEKIVQIRSRETFDSSATPRPGERTRRVTGAAAKPDLAKYSARMAETIERAKADDPKALRAKIAELERASRTASLDGEAMASEYRRGYATGENVERARSSQIAETVKTSVANIASTVELATAHLNDLGHLVRRLADDVPAFVVPITAPLPRAHEPFLGIRPDVVERRTRVQAAAAKANGADLSVGERAVLGAAAQYEHGVTREQLTVLLGYKRSSRNTYLQRLGAKNFVVSKGDRVLATTQGIGALGDDFELLPTGRKLREHWSARLSGGEKTIFDALLRVGGAAVDRETLRADAGYERSSLNTYIQRLRARELVVVERGGGVRANPLLFSESGR